MSYTIIPYTIQPQSLFQLQPSLQFSYAEQGHLIKEGEAYIIETQEKNQEQWKAAINQFRKAAAKSQLCLSEMWQQVRTKALTTIAYTKEGVFYQCCPTKSENVNTVTQYAFHQRTLLFKKLAESGLDSHEIDKIKAVAAFFHHCSRRMWWTNFNNVRLDSVLDKIERAILTSTQGGETI